MIKFLSRTIFVAMTSVLMPIAFVVVCFTYAYAGVTEWADKTWLDN